MTVSASAVVHRGSTVAAEPLLRLTDVHAYIGESHILQGVSCAVAAPGRVTVLLGRNGAGKTTTLRTILGLLPAARGTIRFDGAAIVGDRPHAVVRRGVGYVPEDRDVFAGLTVAENLRLAQRPGAPRDGLARVHALFPDLERRAGQPAGSLSGGQQQMVAIARALVNDNRLLLIDEPSKGLAPVVVGQVTDALAAIKGTTTILLVEQNLAVAQALGDDAVILDDGRVVFAGAMAEVAEDEALQTRYLGAGVAIVSTFVLLTLTGLALAAMYFLLAAGLSLIFGLMDVLNFAHGAFFTWGAYVAWWTIGQTADGLGPTGAFLLALVVATLAVAFLAALVEIGLLRPLYRRPIYQVLVTLGIGLTLSQLTSVIWRPDARPFPQPGWLASTSTLLGARVPNNRFLLIAAALAVLGGMLLFLRRTRYGLIVRAGAENREMVQALGIDVDRAFTLVFALGGALAGLGGVFGAAYFGSINPGFGSVNLIFAFIVVVIGGLGSVTGSALAAVVIGLAQQFGNYYTSWAGDFVVVLLLAVVLLVRPRGLLGTLR